MKNGIAANLLIRKARHLLAFALLALAAANLPVEGETRPEVDVLLVLGIDCSYSVDAQEFRLQQIGISQALISSPVLEAIQNGPLGRVAIVVVQWSNAGSQIDIAPWTLISGPGDATRLARKILETPRLTANGGTSSSAFIDHARGLIATSPYRGLRAVIDVASDGTNNNGDSVDNARDRAMRAGITINGLAILHEIPWLVHYFRNHVVGGPGSFIITTESYDAFAGAMRRKLEREIRGLGIS